MINEEKPERTISGSLYYFYNKYDKLDSCIEYYNSHPGYVETTYCYYDQKGLLEEERKYVVSSETPRYRSEFVFYTYHKRTRLLRSRSEYSYSWKGDDIFDITLEYEYNKKGDITQKITRLGGLEQTVLYEYNENDLPVRELFVDNYDTIVTTFKYVER